MFLLVASILAVSLAFYLYHVDRAMTQVPDEALKFSPHRWTVKEIREAYVRCSQSPVDSTQHLPPKQSRRYVVVGASGLVGNWIASHLLARGEDPKAIRILDLQPPRQDILDLGVTFIKTNVTDKKAVFDAFSEPWSMLLVHLPLTVFHTAAIIRPAERAKNLLPLCAGVNLDGTRNVLEAAKVARASCFVATSSGSIGLRRPSFWIAPWTKTPRFLTQILRDDAPGQPKEHEQFFGNYAVSKYQAEMLVRGADEPGFRTGCIRPANGIYGVGTDNRASIISHYLRAGSVPTWTSSVIQNFVNAENVSIAHLLYEQRLLCTDTNISGQSFVVTDPNPPVAFSDLYLLVSTLSKTATQFTVVPAIPLFLFSYLVEWYCSLQLKYPTVLPPVSPSTVQLQPALFAVSNPHTIADDSRARLAPEQGGLGYQPPITTLDGMCRELAEWNKSVSGQD